MLNHHLSQIFQINQRSPPHPQKSNIICRFFFIVSVESVLAHARIKVCATGKTLYSDMQLFKKCLGVHYR